jgi:hypothetical protein
VNLFEEHRFFVTDPSRFGRCDEPQILEKQNPALENVPRPNPPQFSDQVLRSGKSKVVGQGGCAYH